MIPFRHIVPPGLVVQMQQSISYAGTLLVGGASLDIFQSNAYDGAYHRGSAQLLLKPFSRDWHENAASMEWRFSLTSFLEARSRVPSG